MHIPSAGFLAQKRLEVIALIASQCQDRIGYGRLWRSLCAMGPTRLLTCSSRCSKCITLYYMTFQLKGHFPMGKFLIQIRILRLTRTSSMFLVVIHDPICSESGIEAALYGSFLLNAYTTDVLSLIYQNMQPGAIIAKKKGSGRSYQPFLKGNYRPRDHRSSYNFKRLI